MAFGSGRSSATGTPLRVMVIDSPRAARSTTSPGVIIAAGSLVGGTKRLVPGALVVVAALAATALLDVPLDGGVGERTVTVAADGTPSGEPHLAAGELVLDLRDADTDTVPSAIEATVGLGALVVQIPPGLDVEVVAHTSLGAITISVGSELGGLDIDHTQRFNAGPGEPDLTLDLRVGLGEVEVVLNGR